MKPQPGRRIWNDPDHQQRETPSIIIRVLLFISALTTIPYWICYGLAQIFKCRHWNRAIDIILLTLALVIAGLIASAIFAIYMETKEAIQ